MKKIIDIILEFKKSHSEKKWYGEKKLYNMLVFFKGYSYGEKFEFLPNFDKYVREYFNLENNKYCCSECGAGRLFYWIIC